MPLKPLEYDSEISVAQQYRESGREEVDRLFREKLGCGPTERRWLGWGGASVLVLEAYRTQNPGAGCPTPWVYKFKSLGNPNGSVLESSEICFCDDEDVESLIYPWLATEDLMQRLREDLEQPYVPMYHI